MTLESVSEFFVLSGFFSGIIILFDIANNRAQQNKLILFTWIITGFWGSWIGLYSYFKIGRAEKTKPDDDDDEKDNNFSTLESGINKQTKETLSEKILTSTLYSGSICLLSFILIHYLFLFLSNRSIIYFQWFLTYATTIIMAVTFRYDHNISSIKRIARNHLKKAFYKTFQSDLLSLTVWQTALQGYLSFIFIKISPLTDENTWIFLFIIQIAMFCGFLFTLALNGIALKFGLKKTI